METRVTRRDDGGLYVEVDGDTLSYDFDRGQVQQMLDAYGVFTEEPWAAAERALDEAVADERLYRWVYWPAGGHSDKHVYGVTPRRSTEGAGQGDTREAAAAAAVAFLATLPEPKPELPDPEKMTPEAILCELSDLHFFVAAQRPAMVALYAKRIGAPAHLLEGRLTLSDALRRARRMAGEKPDGPEL